MVGENSACKVTLRYSPSATVQANGATISFIISNNLNDTKAIKVEFPSVKFDGVNLPTLSLEAGAPPLPDSLYPKISGAYYVYYWTIKYTLRMDANRPLRDSNYLRLKNLKFKCESLGEFDVAQDPKLQFLNKKDPDGSSVIAQEISWTINTSIPAKKFTDSAILNDTCTVSADPIEYDLYNPAAGAPYKSDTTLPFEAFDIQITTPSQ